MPDKTATGRRYSGKTAEERRAERRERLLDAGLELFGTRGYPATTIEMLCSAARLNPRYFYEEFETREALLQAVYDRYIAAVTETVITAVEQAPTEPHARLEAGLRAFLEVALADPRAARINYFEMVGVSAQLERRRREVLRAYAEMVAQEIDRVAATRKIAVPDTRLAAVGLVGATDGLIIDALSGDGSERQEDVVATVLTIVDAVLQR